MKKIFYLFLLFTLSLSYAQTHRYIYNFVTKKFNSEIKQYLVLDVNPDNVKFYDYKFLESDSLTQANKMNNHIFKNVSQSEQVLLRDRDSYNNSNFFTNNNGDYFVIKTSDKMDWKLSDETKIYESYKLQKATTKFGGRNWTAWFSKDVPLNEGPYKFRGLPGLIFEIYDENELFHYTLIKNKNLPETFTNSKNWVETYYKVAPISISQKQYFKIKLDDYENPFQNLVNVLKNGGKVNMDGVDITSVSQIESKRKDRQMGIRKFYTPIELDRAIPYPKD